eukprot:bmy_08170T0
MSRIIFPVLFGTFNLVYWATYLNREPVIKRGYLSKMSCHAPKLQDSHTFSDGHQGESDSYMFFRSHKACLLKTLSYNIVSCLVNEGMPKNQEVWVPPRKHYLLPVMGECGKLWFYRAHAVLDVCSVLFSYRFKPFFPFQTLQGFEEDDEEHIHIQQWALTEGRLKVTLLECSSFYNCSLLESLCDHFTTITKSEAASRLLIFGSYDREANIHCTLELSSGVWEEKQRSSIKMIHKHIAMLSKIMTFNGYVGRKFKESSDFKKVSGHDISVGNYENNCITLEFIVLIK